MSRSILSQALEFVGLAPDRERQRRRPSPLGSEDSYYSGDQDLIDFPRTTDNVNCPIVRAEPRSLDEAASVADEIKRQNPIILNLEGVDKNEARRIRDFLGGVTYGLNGYMRKVGSWVYICAPFDMPVEKLVMDPSRQGRERFEADRQETFAEL
jgi:FtsZ-interacting cell division protein YlmF